MKKFVVGVLMFVLPWVASAAGFAQSPIFLSKTPAVEGQRVRVYTIVSNDTSAPFTGIVIMAVDGIKLGSPAATIAAGAAQTVSVNWTPTAGTHTISAQLTNNDGTSVQQVSQDFTVASNEPAPTNTSNSLSGTNAFGNAAAAAGSVGSAHVEPSTDIQDSIKSFSPATENVVAPVFNAIDTGRAAAATQIQKAAQWSKDQTNTSIKSPVSGFVKTPDTKTQNKVATGFWSVLATGMLWIFNALLFIITNAGVFYPVLAILIAYILWRCWKRYRRPY